MEGTALDYALAGAVLVELVMCGRVSSAGDGGKKGRLLVRDTSPIDDPILDRALDRLDAKDPVKAQRALELLTKGLRAAVLERLTDRGLVRREEHKVLWIFARTSWPVAAAEHEKLVRARLSKALVGGQIPDAHTGSLISLLDAVDTLHKVVTGDRKQLKARAAEVGTSEWASGAVKEAVEAVQAAVMMAAVVVATTAATAGSSGSC